jgi:hypothetical protein
MPNTFMAVILDTPNPTGGVHSPFKQTVGSRLARAGLEVAYGQGLGTLGPKVSEVTWADMHSPMSSLVVHFDKASVGTGSGIQIHNTTGFEVSYSKCSS